ncbi:MULTISPECIES: hypothetical protein [Mycobacterium simiae complex]|uniref:Uncharacterized protein n=2 Tax=Mycobacterium simiae complex TaxID=2249310 RepID=A0A024K723_9MYCO|nr:MULTISPECIES: hypothetical protein [Mycobacterium simiae complex]CDO91387.1 hypothetical protein BN973_05796 [Mycobacterium triplex]SOX56836.1 hypothetical protein MAAFP003_5548 [Mycobacterium ahvazicum]
MAGLVPEQWDGEVDGHSFYFRERHGEWRIELDLRPSGHFARTLAGTNSDGTPQYGEKELDEGDIIALRLRTNGLCASSTCLREATTVGSLFAHVDDHSR